MEEKELIWVSKSAAEEFKRLDSVEAQAELVMEVIRRKKKDFTDEQAMLDDDILQFKAVCLKHRQELEKVYDEQAKKLEELWKTQGDISHKVSTHARQVAGEVAPLMEEVQNLAGQVDRLRSALNSLHIYVPENLVKIAETVSQMDEKTKEVLSVLLSAREK